MSRNVQELEDEIGVDLLRRGPRGVSLTAEGKLFLEEARELLKRADESVERVRALVRGEYGELQVGYSVTPSFDTRSNAHTCHADQLGGPSKIYALHCRDCAVGNRRHQPSYRGKYCQTRLPRFEKQYPV